MRVLLSLHHTLTPNAGAEGATLALGRALAVEGCRVDYLSFDRVFAPSRWTRVDQIRYPWAVARWLRAIAKDFDVIDASSGDAWVWASFGRPGQRPPLVLATRSHGLEHTGDRNRRREARAGGDRIRSRYWIYHGGFRLWEVRRSFQLADLSFFLNDEDAELARAEFGLAASRIIVVPHGIGDQFVGAPDVVAANSPPLRLAFVANWRNRKGTATLAAAFDRLVARDVPVRLSVFGSRIPAPDVLADFSPAARAAIDVLPEYRNADLPHLLAGHDVLLFLSSTEGFGLTLLEGMACGLAPIATPVGVATAVVRDRENGVRVGIGDAGALAEIVAGLAANPDEVLRLRRAAQSDARAYRWERAAKTTVAAYERALVTARAGIAGTARAPGVTRHHSQPRDS